MNRLKRPACNTISDAQVSERRRQFLALGAAAAAGGLLSQRAQAEDTVNTKARIVIAGAGAAGLNAASRLARSLRGATIVLIDADQKQFYQPGFTLVASGIKPPSYVEARTADFVPRNIEWIQANVAEFDPDANKVVTDTDRKSTRLNSSHVAIS